MNREQAVEYVYHGKFGTKIIVQDDGVLSQFHVTNILILLPNFGARKPYVCFTTLLQPVLFYSRRTSHYKIELEEGVQRPREVGEPGLKRSRLKLPAGS